MKLYTESSLRKVWEAGQEYWKTSGASITLEELLEYEKPTTLPSNAEIQKEANCFYGLESYNTTFVQGAKYVIDKIKGGTK